MSDLPFRRVIIVGCSGSGKSTLARALGARTGLPVIHLDTLYWKPGWVESTQHEFDQKLDQVLQQDQWIMDGHFGRSLERRIRAADTIVVLDLSTLACLQGVASRIWNYHGRTRPDLPDGCPERIDWEFIEWVCGFRRSSRRKMVETIETFRSNRNVHWFLTRRQMNQWLETIPYARANDE